MPRQLSVQGRGSSSATARDPAGLRVAEDTARNGKDEAIAFVVALHRVAAGTVTVDYATADEDIEPPLSEAADEPFARSPAFGTGRVSTGPTATAARCASATWVATTTVRAPPRAHRCGVRERPPSVRCSGSGARGRRFEGGTLTPVPVHSR